MIPLLESDTHVSAISESTIPSLPPAPGNVAVAHPLLVRHSDVATGFSSSTSTNAERVLAARSHAGRGITGARSRLSRYTRATDAASGGAAAGGVLAANHHNWHIPLGGTRAPNPPVILQRLLGTTTAQDFLQLTGGVHGHGHHGSNAARVIFASNDFQIIAAEEDLFELHESGPSGPYGTHGHGSSTLGSIPSAMLRWTEESRVLDGDSMHDCVSSIKGSIIDHWERLRDEEIAERKEKRNKMIEEENKAMEEEAKKNKERNDKRGKSAEGLSDSAGPSSSAGTSAETAGASTEVKVENDSSVNATTARLAASIVEQILGPDLAGAGAGVSAVGTSAVGTSAVGTSAVDTSAVGTSVVGPSAVSASSGSAVPVSAGASNEADHQPTLTPTAEQVMDLNLSQSTQNDNEITEMEASMDQVAMDVNGVDYGGTSGSNVTEPEVSALRPLESAITPEDLSTISTTSVGAEQVPQSVSNGNNDQESVPAPEPNNTVEVVNSDSNSNSQDVGDSSTIQGMCSDPDLNVSKSESVFE